VKDEDKKEVKKARKRKLKEKDESNQQGAEEKGIKSWKEG
jgi:hypothetical protein